MKCLHLFLIKRAVAILFVVGVASAWAGEHGGVATPQPMQFIVNIGTSMATTRVLLVTIVPEFAHADAALRLAAIRPKVLHRIILVLSSEEVGILQTLKGKQDLQERLVTELNGLINETRESGVSEVFFTNFIIQ